MDSTDQAVRIGQVIKDTYRLTRLIGRGGMGEVYEAQHVSLPRRFAVKFLLANLGLGAEVLERFHREASIAASVGSKHIVEVFDYGRSTDGSYFMVMEYLEGETLTDRIKRHGAYAPAEWLPMFAQLCEGLQAAHAENVVHRDLKPDNVFLALDKRGEEVLKILDFGISKIWTGSSGMTQAGAVMGTPSYMPPEQANGATATTDARADVFSLGSIVYEVLTGKVAFVAPTIPATILKVCYQEPDPLEQLAPHLPPAVIAAVMRALRKAPADRHQSVAAFYQEFLAATGGPAAGTLPPGARVTGGAALMPTMGPSMGVSETTLSSTASELQPTALPTPETESGGGRGTVIAIVAVLVLAVVGGGVWFFGFRSAGVQSKSGGAATPAATPTPDAGVTALTPMDTKAAGSMTDPMRRVPPEVVSGPMAVDAGVAPMDPLHRRAAPVRPRSRPVRPRVRVSPRRVPPMHRHRRRPRHRPSKWAR